MDKNKVFQIVFTIISFIVLIGSVVGLYFMYQDTYGKKVDDKPKITLTKSTTSAD